MVRSKRGVITLVCLLASVSLFAQIRESIAVVHPNINDQGKAAYLEIARYYKGSRFTNTIEFFEWLAKSEGFGSGFLTKDILGRSIIITNKHVVIFADTADISFTLTSGEEVKLEKCPIILKDDDADLAIVLLPAGSVPGIARLELTSDLVVVSSESFLMFKSYQQVHLTKRTGEKELACC